MSQDAQTTQTPTSTPSTAGASAKPSAPSGSRAGVQMKQSLRGQPMDVQMKMLAPDAVQMKGGGPDTATVHAAAAEGTASGGGSMPHASSIQKAFGSHDISGMKGHTGEAASQASAKMGAEAYATGDHVAFKGAPDLHTAAHEAAHVIQQKQGVSLSGGVGQAGDKYEQHADQVADAVVKGESAEGLLSQGGAQKSGGGGGVQQKVVQQEKAATLKTSDAQTTAATDNKVSADDKKKVKSDSTASPTSHPMYATFQARVQSLFSQFPPPPGTDVALLTRNIWVQICGAIDSTQDEMARTPGNDTYSDPARGYVNLESPTFKKAMSEFNTVMATLKQATNAQFMKAKTFGFWSKPEGRALAEKMSDLTLETSGVGAIFDGMPSLNAHANGWDPQLWGSLSNAYGESVAEEMTKKGKSVHVFAGGGTDKTNVFGAIESKALQKGATRLGKTLEEAVTFHAVAANSKSNRTPNLGVQDGDLPGTWYSGHSWDGALKVAGDNFAKLPA